MSTLLQTAADLARSIWDQYHMIPLWVRGCLQPITFGAAGMTIFSVVERFSGGRTNQYFSRGFGQDLAYWFWHSSGLHRLIFSTWILAAISPFVAVFDVKLLHSLPYIARGIIYYMIAEFIAYWYHRAQHASPFLWAFHTAHHSQQSLSFVTFNRFHPVDEFFMEWMTFLPILMMGATIRDWLPLFYLHRVLVFAQHSEVNWRFGWLEKFFVSPMFHSGHHSTDPRYFNRNFGATISLWDHLFGTAVAIEKRPERYGLAEYPSPTLVGSLVTPFQMIWRRYFAKPAPAPAPAHDGTVNTSAALGGRQ